LIPERKAGTRGYDWENGKFWSFDVETFRKVIPKIIQGFFFVLAQSPLLESQYGSSSKLQRQAVAAQLHREPDIRAARQVFSLTREASCALKNALVLVSLFPGFESNPDQQFPKAEYLYLKNHTPQIIN
jgi:hypothetical protein